MKDVKDAVAVMGTPEDFGAEPLSKTPKGKFNIKTGKRLFRNPEEEVIGGVCSGIAAYFGIQDPLWVRLFFVVVAISGGFGVPLYIILWAIMPKPKTASDWLAMRGEPINFCQYRTDHSNRNGTAVGKNLRVWRRNGRYEQKSRSRQ